MESLYEQVKKILEEHDGARNNSDITYMFLIKPMIESAGLKFNELSIVDFIYIKEDQKLPSMELIKEIQQKVQDENEDLKELDDPVGIHYCFLTALFELRRDEKD